MDNNFVFGRFLFISSFTRDKFSVFLSLSLRLEFLFPHSLSLAHSITISLGIRFYLSLNRFYIFHYLCMYRCNVAR